MFANIEIISNNTYNFSHFTYIIPKKYQGKVQQGTIVEIKFRNKILNGIIVSTSSKTNINKLNNIEKVIHNLDSIQFKYLQCIALVNRINVGMLLYNLFDIGSYGNQKKLSSKSTTNISFEGISEIIYKKKNVFFVPSLKQSKLLYDKLKNVIDIDYFQKFGGKDEIIKIIKNKNYSNIILLSNNFEKINIENPADYGNILKFINISNELAEIKTSNNNKDYIYLNNTNEEFYDHDNKDDIDDIKDLDYNFYEYNVNLFDKYIEIELMILIVIMSITNCLISPFFFKIYKKK